MHRVECHGLFLSIGPSLDRPGLIGPRRCHRLGESAQTANSKGRRQAEIEIDVGKRALCLAAMAFQQDGTDPQRVDRLRQEVVRCGAVGLTIERL